MGKKDLLASLLCRTGVIRILRYRRRRSLTVFNYHRVFEGRLSTRFDSGVFGPSVETFAAQMQWLRRSTDVLSEADLLQLVRSGGSIPGRCSMVTFDDGYIDNYRLAFPVLRSLGIPALFFVPTRSIEQRTLGWWDILSYLVKRCERRRIAFNARSLRTETPDDRAETVEHLLRFIKSTPASAPEVLNAVSRACDVVLPTREEQSRELMTWEHIDEMRRSHMAIGSHTHTHSVLSHLDEEAQLAEMTRSKQELESRLNRAVHSVSYPVGGASHFTAVTKEVARAAGYAMGFSFRNQINRGHVEDPFEIGRISPPDPLARFAAATIVPSIFL